LKLKKPHKRAHQMKRPPKLQSPKAAYQQAMAGMLPHQQAAFDHILAQTEARAKAVTPEECKAAGVMFNGLMPDKGEKNGSCNRTACQMPLAGKPQFWMKNHSTGGRLYYCGPCEVEFSKWDRIDRPGEPMRCTPDEDN